jgi:hypothetical protein
VLKSTVALTSEPITGQGLYEWAGHGAPLQLVSVFPAGEEATSELRLGGLGEQNGGVMRNAISSQGPDEGRRVIWTGLEGEESRLYLRDTSTHETVRLDKAQGVPQPEESKAVFDTASADGKKIFFTDPQPLTPDSTVGEVEEEGEGDLYLCEVVEEGGKSACKLKDLTAEVKTPAENAAVQGVLGASDDGSYVYFVANGVLATDAGRGQCEVREPAELQQETEGLLPVESCNLYVRHFNGTVWEPPKFLAALTTQDEHDWHAIVKGQGSLAAMTTRVSPNGLYLSFMSNRSLTGYNNVDAKEENVQDEEVFLFSYGSDQVICASCNPQRNEKSEPVRPHGVLDQVDSGEGLGLVIDRPENWKGRWVAANIPGWTARGKETAVYQPRYLSDSGRLFFNSVDGLIPADKNGKADVYEYEPAGEGTCTSSAGCISLISSGTSEQESAFLDASLGGSNAFFLTSAKLSTQDVDTGFDVYDARVCTGSSPCLTPSEERARCTSEEGCRGSGSTVPALPGAPPTSLPSSGNAGKLVVLSNTARGKSKLTRAQLLARELKKCKKLKAKKKRHACERRARKKYGPVKKGKSSRRSHGRRR